MTFRVVPYSEAWPKNFVAVRGQLSLVFADPSIKVEHIGNKTVPGPRAKPVIDVLVGAPPMASIEPAIPSLETAGYVYIDRYEAEFPTRRYFVKTESDAPRVHIHAVCMGSAFWTDRLAFRNALRAEPKLRDSCARLKLDLARLHEDDKASYMAAKAPFINQVLAALDGRPANGPNPSFNATHNGMAPCRARS